VSALRRATTASTIPLEAASHPELCSRTARGGSDVDDISSDPEGVSGVRKPMKLVVADEKGRVRYACTNCDGRGWRLRRLRTGGRPNR
jgi:hypothetical protein